MKRNSWRAALVGACLAGLAVVGVADVVTLSDGSRLLGKVERMSEGKLIFVTQFAGTLEIDAKLLVRIETDEPVNVGMTTGDRLVGPIEWKEPIDRAVVETELGGIAVNVEGIEAIWPRDGKSPEVMALEAQMEQVRAEAEAARAKWTATFEAGLLYREGNKEVFNVRGGMELVRKSPKDLLKFYLTGVYAEDSGKRSEHEVKGGAYYEYLFTERWFAYARSELEYDEFENLDLRFSTAFGPGYYWIKKPDHELKTRAGIGFLHESYRDDTTANKVEGEVALEYRLDVAPWMQFKHGTTWYPTFEALRDYRIVSDTALIFPLANSEIWKLKLGAKYEYDAIPNPGFERLDQTYYANILAEIK